MKVIAVEYFLELISELDKEHIVRALIADGNVQDKCVIIENKFFVIPLSYTTKSEAECLWEAHRKFYDVHLVLSGSESHFVSEMDTMKTISEYDLENDYQLFDGTAQHMLELIPSFCIVYAPNDVHKSGVLMNGEEQELRKIVIKIESDLIENVFRA